MAKNEREAKIKFSAETKTFQKSINSAESELKVLRAELKLNEAQMRNTGESTEGLERSQSILTEQLTQAQAKTEALRGKLDKAIEIYGEGSTVVTNYKCAVANARTEEENITRRLGECTAKLEEQAAAANKAETKTEALTSTISEQQKTLDKLKDEYTEAVLTYGKNSTEAKKLAGEIKDLSGNLDKNKKALSQAEKSADELDETLDDVSAASEKASEGFTVMKGAMANLVADGISKVVDGFTEISSGAVTMMNDIDRATNTVIARTGATTDEAEEFRDMMLSIYNNNFGESLEEIADAVSIVKTNFAGFDNGHIQKITEQAFLLRDTFGFDVTESVRTAGTMMRNFGMDSDRTFNLIAAGAQEGLNVNGDMLDILNEYAPHFKQLGFNAEYMFSVLNSGAKSGAFSLDKIGDAVKEFGIRVKDESDATKNAFTALGLDAEKMGASFAKGGNDAYLAYRDVVGALLDVKDPLQQNQIGVALFGTMWEDLGVQAMTALNMIGPEFNYTAGKLEEINDIKYDDLGSQLENIGRNITTGIAKPMKEELLPATHEFVEETDWEGVGETIGGAFAFAAQSMMSAVSWMAEHKAATIAIVSVIGALSTAISILNIAKGVKLAMDAAEVTSVWALVAAYWAQAAAGMAALWPILLIVAAVAAVIAIVVLCIKYWDEIVAAVKKAGAAIVSALQTAWEWIKNVFSTIGSWINTNVIQPVAKFFTGLWDGIVSGATAVWNGIVTAVKAAWDFICNVVQFAIMLIGSILKAAFDIITLPFRFIWENCKEYVFAAWEWIKNAVSVAINAVKNVIVTVFTAVKNFFVTVWNGIKSVFTTVWNAIVNFLTPIINKIKSVFVTVFTAIKNFFVTIWNGIKSVAISVWTAIKNFFVSVWNGIKSTATSVWNAIKTAIMKPVNAAKDAISKAWNATKTATANAFNSVKSTATSVWNGIKNAIMKPINAAKDGVKSAIDKIKGFFSNLKLKLPNIKLPHFSIEGKFSLSPPSVPKLKIDWYAKAMSNPMILNSPTIFGQAGGRLLGGGEAGSEMIGGTNTVMGMIQSAVDRAIRAFDVQALAVAVEHLANRPIDMYINGRQFAQATASDTDNVGGLRNSFKSRGLIVE